MTLLKSKHAVYKLTYHIVFVTKYRRKCITAEMFNFMRDLIKVKVTQLGGSVVEVNHDIDHIHMLIELPPTVSISKIVNILKTSTSK